MEHRPMIVTPQDRPESLNVVGEEIAVLASGGQTGSYEIFLQTGPEGSGPPPHNHPWDEAFYVLQGQVAFSVGDAEQVAECGTLVQVPAGTTHWFRFAPGGGQMLSVTSREGAADLFTEIDRKVSSTDPDFGTLVEVITAHGVTVVPPPA